MIWRIMGRGRTVVFQFLRTESIQTGAVVMGKEQKSNKENKKQPAMTAKEKKAAKKAKKNEKTRMGA